MKPGFLLITHFLVLTCAVHLTPAATLPDALLQEEEVIYGRRDGMALTMDYYQPRDQSHRAAVLLVHSGGWESWWQPIEEGRERALPLIEKGYSVFLIRHSSSPKYGIPDQVEDLKNAVRFVRLHARRYNIDPERLGMMGYSSGGHLTLCVATMGDDGDLAADDPLERTSSRVAAAVAFVAPTDLGEYLSQDDRDADFPYAAWKLPRQLRKVYSPVHNISDDDPPLLLIAGKLDPLVDYQHSVRMHEALQQAGMVSDLMILEHAEHAFEGEDSEVSHEKAYAWFDRHLLPVRE